MSQDRGDQSQGPGAAYKGYTVYDQHYEKIGKVDDLFVDAYDRPEYIGVKMGLLGTSSTLIPIEIVRINDRRQLVEISADEEAVKNAPTFDDDRDITPEYEHHVYGYFGLESPFSGRERSAYEGYYTSHAEASRDEDLRRTVDTEYGERTGSPGHPAETAPTGGGGLDVPSSDRGSEAQRPREEPAASATDPLDADAATREGGARREEIEVQPGVRSDGDIRVYKRAARPAR